MNLIALYYAAARALAADRKGVTAIEYGVIAALIIVVCIAILVSVGTSLNGVFSSVNASL